MSGINRSEGIKVSDYRATPAGRAAAQKYSDILDKQRPEPSYKHPRMSLSNRAKIFSPFAALRGYDEEIKSEALQQALCTKQELSDEDKGKLSDKLLQVRKGIIVTVCYFVADTSSTSSLTRGFYQTITGTVDRIDPVCRELRVYSQKENTGKESIGKRLPTVIPFDDILTLSGADIVDIDEFLEIE